MSSILSSLIPTGLASLATANPAQLQKPDIPWWFWVVMGSAFIILVWMLFNRPKEDEEETEEEEKVKAIKIPEPEESKPQEDVFTLSEEDSEFEVPVDEQLFIEEEEEPPSPFLDAEVEEEIKDAEPFEDYRIQADDLTRIDGITAKTSKILAQADIHTYEQLASTEVEKLQVVLATAGIFLTDPSSWPVQARMAADGEWDELRQYQNENKND